MLWLSKSADGVGDAAAGLGLHFLHMSEGPFSHDAGHIITCLLDKEYQQQRSTSSSHVMYFMW